MEALSWRRIAAVVALAAACLAAGLGGTAQAAKKFDWLCKPGLKSDPCEPGLKTSLLDNSGNVEKVVNVKRAAHRKVDCFYVYPTVSDQDRPNANLHKDPEVNSIALYQAARYSQYCNVYAPVYRQLTLKEIMQPNIPQHVVNVAYNSALAAWKTYLKKFNDGRDFVLLGHSQGSFILRKLVADEVDGKRSVRKRMLSAILLGGNVNGDQSFSSSSKRVPPGDFENIGPCRSESQLHCVMGFSTFNAPVPSDALFGRTTLPEHKVLCTNPAALGGGSAPLESVLPSEPFAPGTTIGIATKAVGFPQPAVNTPFVEYDEAYTGACSSADGASVLQVAPEAGAPTLHPIPSAQWGLHLVDGNIALGNFVDVVHKEIQAAN
jgi:Protein of unknown function (DUF3089)